jgi:hypothetical protein
MQIDAGRALCVLCFEREGSEKKRQIGSLLRVPSFLDVIGWFMSRVVIHSDGKKSNRVRRNVPLICLEGYETFKRAHQLLHFPAIPRLTSPLPMTPSQRE